MCLQQLLICGNVKKFKQNNNIKYQNTVDNDFLKRPHLFKIEHYLPSLINSGFSSFPSVSNQLGETKAIKTNKNATIVQPVATFPVFDLPIFINSFVLE